MLKIGVSIGDLNGIGIEVLLKALQDRRLFNQAQVICYGSLDVLAFYRRLLHMEGINHKVIANANEAGNGVLNVIEAWQEEVRLNPGNPDKATGKYTVQSLEKATKDLIAGQIDGLVTLPINKDVINGESFPYRGHTEFFKDQAGAKECLMFLTAQTFKIGVATNHIPVSGIATSLTIETIVNKATIMDQSLKQDFGFDKPKIAILGLNPHAGDNGLIGDDEKRIIIPAIEQLKEQGKLVFGPFPPDGFFGLHQYRSFDGVLAMYHDQGLIPFKMMHFDDGVNFTAGLPFVRTSPDHGTAYNIVGKNVAEPSSFIQAFFTAIDVVRNRRG